MITRRNFIRNSGLTVTGLAMEEPEIFLLQKEIKAVM